MKGQGDAGKRKVLLGVSLVVNLGLLGLFKYFNFFLDNFVKAFTFMGGEMEVSRLSIILPVGISFYTFQTLSYTIDVYRRDLEPSRDFVAFMAYVSFFPQLVAGPIERATNLLPHFFEQRKFDYALAVNGLKQILWGLFKKVVIADNCAEFANIIFNNSESYTGSTLVLGAFFFAIQRYGDFSGYSDIAIGTARLFGFSLMRNFAFPYFSRDIAEFWRRWHISLSTWFRDYVYIPLGGSRGGTWGKVRNTFIIFIVSGFWHGANWTFIIWGLLNALYFLPLLLSDKTRSHIQIVAKGRTFPAIGELMRMLVTFGLTLLAWIFFRARDVTHAFTYIRDLLIGLTSKAGYVESYNFAFWEIGATLPLLILFFVLGRDEQFGLSEIGAKWPTVFRWIFYYALIISILVFAGKQQEFVYFQF